MKLLNNGGYITPNSHFLSPNEAFSTELRVHLIELLVKVVPWEFPQ